MMSCNTENTEYQAGYELGKEAGTYDARKNKPPRENLSFDDPYEIGYSEGYKDSYEMTMLDKEMKSFYNAEYYRKHKKHK